ncbi:DNA polymerase [Saccharopolyspora sp. NPDC003752]
MTGDYLPVATRAWTDQPRALTKPGRSGDRIPETRHVLVIDTETTIDTAQALTFGCYRYCRVDAGPDEQITMTTVAEGLIYADDLPETDPDGYAALVDYARTHEADVDLFYLRAYPDWRLRLYSHSEFVDKWIYSVAYRDHWGKRDGREPATLVMFNAPFDLSRLAGYAAEARDGSHAARFAGGFSLALWTDENGNPREWRPRVRVKSIDSKRSLKGFSAIDRTQRFRGHFLDLRTLVFSLTGSSHSLASACQAFGVEHGKTTAEEHGHITPEYIDYCRRDVQATTELYEKTRNEYALHPINLQETKAYSPASISKSYLRAMGITPVLDRMPDFPADVLGSAMSAFYGGRAESFIRHTPMPVMVCDFTSMYPTVDALMNLWEFLTHDTIDTVDATQEIQALLNTITLDRCFDPDTWREFVGIAQVIPDGDILPVRARYSREPNWNIGVNPLHSTQPLWYTIPDLIASALLTGKPPRIVRALRFVPAGNHLATLTPVRLRGQVDVDPARDDFFRTVVEQRQAVKDSDPRLAAFLKVLANAGSYGIFAQMDAQELPTGQRKEVTVYGAAEQPWTVRVTAPEQPGEYCFPPIAACITGAARLMLAMLERCVTDAGGVWVFCDTDSMAIVADTHGSLIPCPGGGHTLPDGRAAVRALTLDQVEGIRQRFAALNPYQPDAVTDILKAEFTGWCYSISAKRYALYQLDPTGIPDIESTGEDTGDGESDIIEIGKTSEHGLGYLLNPSDPESNDRNWIRHLWQFIIRNSYGLTTTTPEWLHRPALSRISISSPLSWRPFTEWNTGKPYREQIKPFNFLLSAQIASVGYPPDVDPRRFHLIAPYDPDPTTWADLPWRNLHAPHGPTYRVNAGQWEFHDGAYVIYPPEDLVQLRTYENITDLYRAHPEPKTNGADGQPCTINTVGMLHRRTVHLARLHHIGKETNRLDDTRKGITSPDQALTNYDQPISGLIDLVIPALASHTAQQLADHTGLSERQIERIRSGKTLPRPRTCDSLTQLAVETALADLNARQIDHPWKKSTTHRTYAQWESVLAYWRDNTNSFQRVCPCGCGKELNRRQKYASNTCRMRHRRRTHNSCGPI